MIYITLKSSICSGVCFQYSCEWYIEQIIVDLFQAIFLAFSERAQKHFSWILFLLKLEFLDCRRLALEKKRKLCKGFFLNIYFFVITSRKESAGLFLKKKASLRIFSYVFKTFVAAISKHSHEKIYGGVW